MGVIPIIIWAISFVTLIMLVSYSSLRSSRKRYLLAIEELESAYTLYQQAINGLPKDVLERIQPLPTRDDLRGRFPFKELYQLFSEKVPAEFNSGLSSTLEPLFNARNRFRQAEKHYKSLCKRKPSAYMAIVAGFGKELK